MNAIHPPLGQSPAVEPSTPEPNTAAANKAAHEPTSGRVKKKQATVSPWRQPSRIFWLVAALGLSIWMILHIPGKPASAASKLLSRADQISGLYGMVGLAAFLGGLMEQRRWHLLLSRGMGWLARFAHLPQVVGLAMPTAIISNPAANSLLVSSHDDGELQRSALICGGMINSYLAFVSHSLRVMYPVVGAVGLAGIIYFSAQFLSGLTVVMGVLLWHRLHSPQIPDELSTPDDVSHALRPLPSWPLSCKRAVERAATLLFRMFCLTLPIMLGMEWLIKSGAFDFWNQLLPGEMTRFFSPEIISVMLAQFGGLVQSAAVAANFRDQGLLTTAQIVLAMLAGSALGNPFRALRRNLPTALGIFPAGVACIIVIGMQLSRFVTAVALICVIVEFFHP